MKPTSYRTLFALATFGLAGLPASLSAQIAWDGDTDNVYETDTNWVGDVAPADDLTTDIAQFTGGTVDLTTTRQVGGIDMNAATTLAGTGSLEVGSFGFTGTENLTLGGSTSATFTQEDGALNYLGDIFVGSGSTLSASRNAIKLDIVTHLTDTLITLDGGTIAQNGDHLDLAGRDIDLTANGGTLRHIHNRNIFGNYIISGTGHLTLVGEGSTEGRVQLTEVNTYSGGTTVTNGGQAWIYNNNSLGADDTSVDLDTGGTIFFASNADLQNRAIAVNAGGGVINMSGKTSQIRGAVTGSGDLNIHNNGFLEWYSDGSALSGNILVDNGTELRVRTTVANMLGTGVITLDNGAYIKNRNNNPAINNDIVIGSGGGGIEVGWTNRNITVNGVISGDGPFVVRNDSSSFRPTAVNTYTGGTEVQGFVNLRGEAVDDRLGTGAITLNDVHGARGQIQNWNGGTGSNAITTIGNDLIVSANGGRLKAGWDDKLEFTGVASGSGQLTIESDSGSVILSNSGNTFSGDIVLNSHGSSQADLIVGSLESGSYTGVISGDGTLEYAGSGTQTLTGANTYTGGTTISGGTLELTNLTDLGTGPVTLAAGGTLDLNGILLANDFLNPTGGTLLANGAAMDLSPNTFTSNGGSFTVDGTADVTLDNMVRTAGNPTVIKEGSGTLTMTGTADNVSFRAEVNAGTFVMAKTSTGTVHAIGGFLTINGGTAELGGTGGDQLYLRSTVDLNGGIFDVNTRNEQIKVLNLHGGDITGTTGVLTVNSDAGAGAIDAQSGTVAVGLAGDAALTKSTAGTVTLAGAGNYTGDTTINEGTLALGATTDLADSSAIFINGGTSILQLTDLVTDTVNELWIDGVPMAVGTYGTTASAATFKDDVHFSGTGVLNVTSMGSNYASWAAANVGGQTSDEDFNLDGVQNGIAFFMNDTGRIALPGLVGGTVTWSNGGNIAETQYGVEFVVRTSVDLVNWTDVPVNDPNLSNTAGSVSYTPTAGAPFFVRLEVTPIN